MLLKLLAEKQPVRVGVIAPYKAQKQKIMEALRESGADNKHLQWVGFCHHLFWRTGFKTYFNIWNKQMIFV